jgi:hypothetical protein
MFFMKKLNYLVIALIFSGVLLMGCGGSGGDKKSDEDLQVERLAKTWVLDGSSTVTRDLDDLTALYNGFRITFNSSNTYTIQGDVNNIFANTSGTWDFPRAGGDPTSLNSILFDGDTRAVTINVNNDGTVLSFDFSINNDTPIGGRTEGLDGDYQFSNLISGQ